MRGQWGYAAISAMMGIAAAYSHAAAAYGCAALYLLYCFFVLRRTPFVVCVCLAVAASVYMSEIEKGNKPSVVPASPLTATIVSTPMMDGDKLSFTIQTVQHEKLRLSYTMSSLEEKQALEQLRTGMVCRFQGERKEPQSVRNFGAFDYKQYLHRQHIHFMFIASSFSSCKQVSPSFFSWLFAVRQSAVQYVEHTFPKEASGFMNALIYGDRQGISGDVEAAYQQFGLIHLLAISGSHISLLVVMCFYMLQRAGCTRETATVLLLVIIPLYMFVAGASPSVVRASVTAIVVLVFFIHSSRISGIDALSMTALCMLLFDPYVLFDIGFQFSFFSTFVLLLTVRYIVSRETGMLRGFLYIAIAAQLSSLPITIHYFGQFSPHSFVLNLLYVPFLSFLILPLCLAALGISIFAAIPAEWIASFLAALIRISNGLLEGYSVLPLQTLTFGRSPLWLTWVYICLLVFFFMAWEGHVLKKYKKWIIVLFVVVLCIHYTAPYMNPYGSVTFLDVGQGDCIIIQLPFGKVYVIDTGGRMQLPKEEWQKRKNEFSVGADIVLPFLQRKGVRRIDKLIITHGDIDHAGAAQDILGAIPVTEVILGEKPSYSAIEQEIEQTARQKGVRVTAAKSGSGWREGGAEFKVLSPFGDETADNDGSIVLHAKIGGLAWLFTGDLEEAGEDRLIRAYRDLRADVLKVGHHGSRTSTSEELLNAVQPTAAVISAGQGNRYGHPHQEVMERLTRRGIHIWRTDEHGAVSYTFYSNRGTFRSALHMME